MEEGPFTIIVSLVLLILSSLIVRLILVLPAANKRLIPSKSVDLQTKSECGKIMILLGSGGHTGEMIKILEQSGGFKNMKRQYFISSGDETSILKLKQFEESVLKSCPKDYKILNIYRARGIGDNKTISILKTLWSFKSLIGKIDFQNDIFLTNGPGTAIPIAYMLFLLKFLGFCHTKIIYVESLARVKDLSLTGKLILPISDRIMVQWKSLTKKYRRCEYHGILV